MKLIFRTIVTAILVIVIAHFMAPSVTLQEGVITSLKVAIVLGLLNFFVKPILVLFTFPVTVFTLGLFLLVINAIMILLCSHFVQGFHVQSFGTAFFFSIILSLSQSLVYKLSEDKK